MFFLSFQTNPVRKAIATIQQVDSVDSVVPTTERVRIADLHTTRYSLGDSYSISPKVFHCTDVPIEIAAITIVRADVVTSGGPRTLVPAGYSGHAPKRAYFDEADGAMLFEQIEAIL